MTVSSIHFPFASSTSVSTRDHQDYHHRSLEIGSSTTDDDGRKKSCDDSGGANLVAKTTLLNTAHQTATTVAFEIGETVFGFDVDLFNFQKMIVQLENVIGLQEELSQFRICDTPVDIGYHFTKRHFLDSIKRDGLLSAKEQGKDGWKSFGPGVYTANNPVAFSWYGEVGKKTRNRVAGS
jgi:hypothetical protein